ARPLKYLYGRDSTHGFFTREIRLDAAGGDSEWTKTYRNFLGQEHRVEFADGRVETRQFNSRGQLTRQTGSDGVVTLFQYNPRGEIEYTVLDMDRDGVIDFSGEDRLVRTQTGVSTARGTASIWTATYVHREMNSDTGRLDNVIERSVNGRDVWE